MKIYISNIRKHFKKICTHKYWVAHYCFKFGLYWRGLVHDMSKFSPTEFWESMRYYQGTSSPITACKAENGYSKAWLHHKGRNKHHYEYWVDYLDDGGRPIVMPYKYTVEMVCDYLGAARAYMGNEFTYTKEYEWWMKEIAKHPAKMMHPNTQEFVTRILKQLADCEPDDDVIDVILSKSYTKYLYNSINNESSRGALIF